MTLRAALLESNNAAAVLLQQRIGSRPVLKLAKRRRAVEDRPTSLRSRSAAASSRRLT